MKFIVLGDIHRRPNRPRSRTDDYVAAQDAKLEYVMDFAYNDPLINHIFHVGDVFEEPNRQPLHYLNSTMELLKVRDFGVVKIVGVQGNHDIPFRDLKSQNTSYRLLEIAGTIETLGAVPYSIDGVDFYGVSYGEDIPEIKHPNKFNVLVAHVGVSKDAPAFEMAEPWYTSRDYMKLAKGFNLILTGHNHTELVDRYRSALLLQPGSIMRSTIAQTEHEPCFYVYDTETQEYERHVIPHAPADEVFDIQAHVDQKEAKANLVTFADKFTDDVEFNLDFESNLEYQLKEQDVEPAVVKIVQQCLEKGE